MPQNVRLSKMDKLGISRDTPSIVLPHNQLSDALNVRFRNNAINKIRGEVDVLGGAFQVPVIVNGVETANLENISLSNLHYWPNPRLVGDSSGFYITGTPERQYLIRPEINRSGASRIAPRLVNPVEGGQIQFFDSLGRWDTDTFTGGFALIHNNGINTPQFMLDGGSDDTLTLAPLPNWDYQADTTGYNVSAGVIRSFGNVLIAGNLSRTVQTYNVATTYSMGQLAYIGTLTQGIVYRSLTNNNVGNDPATDTTNWEMTDIQRVTNLTGTIRVSNAAAPGAVPASWDPLATGANFAEERELTDTSEVRNIVPLQGQAVIYTSDSIHSLQLGVNNIITSQVAQGWGTLNNTSVIEFDGKHFVVDVDDIYLFSGHPGNIQSVADARVRDYLYSNLHPVSFTNAHVVRNKSQDEIWVNFPNRQSIEGFCNEALIWNYRNNTWTRRTLNDVIASTDGPVTGGGLPQQQFIFEGNTGQTRQFAGNPEVQTITIANDAFTTPGDEPIGFDLDIDGNTGAQNYTPQAISGQQDSYTRSAEAVRRVIAEDATPAAFMDTQTLFTDPSGNTVTAELQTQRFIETTSETIDNDATANQIGTTDVTVTPTLTEYTDTDFLTTDTESKTITSQFSGSGDDYNVNDLNSGQATEPDSGIDVSSTNLTVRPSVGYNALAAQTVTQIQHFDGSSRQETVSTTTTRAATFTADREWTNTVTGTDGYTNQSNRGGTQADGSYYADSEYTFTGTQRGLQIRSLSPVITLPNATPNGGGSVTINLDLNGTYATGGNINFWGGTVGIVSANATIDDDWGARPTTFATNPHHRIDTGTVLANVLGTVGSGSAGAVGNWQSAVPGVARGAGNPWNITHNATVTIPNLGAGGQFRIFWSHQAYSFQGGSNFQGVRLANTSMDLSWTVNGQEQTTTTSTQTVPGSIATLGATSPVTQTFTLSDGRVVNRNPTVLTRTSRTVPAISAVSNADPTTILGTRTGSSVSPSPAGGRFNYFEPGTGGANVVLSNNNQNARLEVSGSSTRFANVNTQSGTVYTVTNSSDGESDITFTPGALTRTGTTTVTGDVYSYALSPSGTTGTIPLTGGTINNVPANETVTFSAEFTATPSGSQDTTTVIMSNPNSSITGTRDLQGFTHLITNTSGVSASVTATTDDGSETQTIAAGATARFFDVTNRSRDNTLNSLTSSRMLYDYAISNSGSTEYFTTIRATASGDTTTTDVNTGGFTSNNTTLALGSELPTYTAFVREGEDFTNHHILSVTNNGNQDFDLTMITHGSTNTFNTGTVSFNPATEANLIVPPGVTRMLYATASVTSNTDAGRLEVGAGNDHTIVGVGRYTGNPSTLTVGFDANVDAFDVPPVTKTFTGQQTPAEAAQQVLGVLNSDTVLQTYFTTMLSTTDDTVIEFRVRDTNRAEYTPSISFDAGTTARGDTTFNPQLTQVLADTANPGSSSAITLSVTAPAVPHRNSANDRVDQHADGFSMPRRDLQGFTESLSIIFSGDPNANGTAIATEIAAEVNSNTGFPFSATSSNNVVTLTSKTTTIGDTVQPANRPYGQIGVTVDETGIALLEDSDFTEATTTDGLTDEIHGAATVLNLTRTTNGMTETLQSFTVENISNTDIASQVFTALNDNASNDYVITLTNSNTIDIRLADLTIQSNQSFNIQVIDLDTGMPATETTTVTGSVSGTTRTSSPISTDNLLTVEASGNDEIFNNERPWPTDEFNDARTFVVMAQPNRNTLTAADIGFTFPSLTDPTMTRNYTSFFERQQIDLTEIVDSSQTKSFRSFYLQSQALPGQQNSTFAVKVRAEDVPAELPDLTIPRLEDGSIDQSTNNEVQEVVLFMADSEYKTDVRIHGRYLSYRIEDNGDRGWSIPTIEFELDIGGRR